MSTRQGTRLFPRGPLGTSKAGRFGPRGSVTPVTRQGSRLIPTGGLSYFGTVRGALPTVFGRAPFTLNTRQGVKLFSRGPLGTNLTRTAILPTTVDLPVGHFTFTPIAFSFGNDTTIELPAAIDETYTAGITFSVDQGGSDVSLPVGHLRFSPGLPFLVSQLGVNDHEAVLPQAHLTFTAAGVPFTIDYSNEVDLPVGHFTFSGLPFNISVTLPGEQTLTQTDIIAIWNNISINGYTPQSALGIIASAVAGRLSGADQTNADGTKTLLFKALDGSHTVITATVDPSGNRVTISLTP